jgi:hypothetical protein
MTSSARARTGRNFDIDRARCTLVDQALKRGRLLGWHRPALSLSRTLPVKPAKMAWASGNLKP